MLHRTMFERKSRERIAFENQLQEYAERENENSEQGLGIGWLLMVAIPCWLLISYVALRCVLWGAV